MGFSSCGSGTQWLWHTDLVALPYVESSQTRDQTHVLCIGRWILNHWTTREVPGWIFNSIPQMFSRPLLNVKPRTGHWACRDKMCTVPLRVSLVIQWFRLHSSTVGSVGSSPGWGTKTPHATRYGPPKKKIQIVTFHRLGTVDWPLGPAALPCPLYPRQRGSVRSEPDAEM